MNKNKLNKETVILGAGPAGLAAGLKLSEQGIPVIIIEKDNQVGGMSKTIKYKGYSFDLGPHRFFTKSPEILGFWKKLLGSEFLGVSRLTRIYYRKKFFNYPLKPINALFGLGLINSTGIFLSYIKSKIFPYKEEINFEQWVSNRFGKKLYRTFFKTYTEKLWGIPCTKIQAEWVAQRIKGLSLRTAIKNAFFPDKSGKIKTLVEEFYYPKHGAGSMYKKMAEEIEAKSNKIILGHKVAKINLQNYKIKSVTIKNLAEEEDEITGDNFISSIPITALVKKLFPKVPKKVFEAASRLKYRSTIFINLVIDCPPPFPDNWIYVHEPATKMLRLTSVANFSPHMLKDKDKTALALEYVCNEGGRFWKAKDRDLIKLGIGDLKKIGLIKKGKLIDGFVVRVPKTYPVYNQDYLKNLKIIRSYLKKISNLQLIGRYGMFKYNNMDHSIMTGFAAAENILENAKKDIWKINTDEEYHEQG